MVVADALNCQKETANIIIEQEANYLLCVKDNLPNLKENIADFIQDITLPNTMRITSKNRKNYRRIEKRTAYITDKIEWLEQRAEWNHLCCIGTIHTEFETKKEKQMNGIIIFQVKI